jgi:hypothetical protein
MRLHGRFTSFSTWYASQAAPMSTSNLMTVFFATPVMRTVALMLFPSTSEATTWICLFRGNRFILTIMRERLSKCKHFLSMLAFGFV